jgi:hypothetical protein
MAKLVPWVSLLSFLLLAAGSVRGDDRAATPKSAVEALLSRLDKIAHDAGMTSAKRAMLAAGEVEKFNQQYKGQPLSVRLKIQDVVPYAKGSYVSAGNPDLALVQFSTARFQINLPIAEAAAISKDSVLVVSGTLSVATQPRPRAGYGVLEPGAAVSFPSRANSSYRIWLDNATWQVEHGRAAEEKSIEGKSTEDKTAAADAPAGDDSLDMPSTTHGRRPRADRANNNAETRSVDDLKAFFLKGIVPGQYPHGGNTGNTLGTTGPGLGSAMGSRPGLGSGQAAGSGAGTGRVKHNRVYVAEELIRKFGEPATRVSKDMTETWTFKCKDGMVRVRFTPIFNVAGASASKLRLEITSVDAQSGLGAGTGRFGR